MERQPRGRDVLKLLWSIHRRDAERDLKRMAGVRRPLLRVVHSQLNDEEAVRRIRPDVEANYGAARATLDHVREADEFGSGYITDRAIRILEAAMNGTPPAPISAEHRGLFERERELGWMSLEDAFSEIAGQVPGLTELLTAIANEPDRSSRRLELMQELQATVGQDFESASDALGSVLAGGADRRQVPARARRQARFAWSGALRLGVANQR